MPEYKVRIRYEKTDDQDVHPSTTVAEVVEVSPESETVVARGEAYRNPVDMFSRITGRRLALTRALATSELNKQQRTAVWEAYFRRCKK